MPDGKFISLDQRLYDYVVAHGNNSDPLLKELATETATRLGRISGMQIAPEQGTFMGMLARAIGARNAVEVGTFTGYSAICVAHALPPDGRMLCCDVSEEWTAIARRYWAKAGVAGKITLKLAPAIDTLRALPTNDPIDFAFIDADKTEYIDYFEETLKRLRRNGLIMLDNTLRDGTVLEPGDSDSARVTAELNDRLAKDDRVDVALLGVADGITLVRKK